MTTPPTMLVGEDVVATPGQALNDDELTLLFMLADGHVPSTIERTLNTDRIGVRHIERGLQAKLGAKNKVHIITRGFVLGVLAPRALCLLLAMLSVGVTPDGHPLRAPRRGRTPITATRSAQKRASTSGGNHGHFPTVVLYAQA